MAFQVFFAFKGVKKDTPISFVRVGWICSDKAATEKMRILTEIEGNQLRRPQLVDPLNDCCFRDPMAHDHSTQAIGVAGKGLQEDVLGLMSLRSCACRWSPLAKLL